MNIYSECIEQLAAVQEVDEKILKLEKEILSLPIMIENLNKEFESAKNELNKIKEEIKHLLSRKKDMENQIQEIEENIRKSQRELNEVKSNDAFKALLVQIENLKKNKDEVETKELELLEEIDKISVEEKNAQNEYKIKEEEKNRKIKEIELKETHLKEEVEKLKKKREELVVTVEPELLARYDNIRTKKNGIALVSVKTDGKNYFCGGCNMKLTPDQAVNIHKKNTIVICENCSRMMFLKSNTAK